MAELLREKNEMWYNSLRKVNKNRTSFLWIFTGKAFPR